MSCFGGVEYTREEIESLTKNQCEDCGDDVDEDGNSFYICSYSPLSCETCGSRPCDQSC